MGGMSEQTEQPTTLPETRVEASEARRGVYDLIQTLRGGKLDPITALLILNEIRRMERDEERWALERQRLLQQNSNREIDIEKLVEKLNSAWEKRFMEYQSRIESLLMKEKIEEAEKRAEEAEKKLKAIEAEKQQEELIKARIMEATAPLQERIKELQGLIAMKTAGMTNEEKKSFFERLGEEIEKTIGEEVTSTIAGAIKESLLKTFAGKEEAPVTPEGKINWGKLADKWISKTLDTLNAIVSKLPPRTPPQRQITPIPETALPPSAASIQQPTAATVIQPATETIVTQPTETITTTAQPEAISQEIAEEAKEIKEAAAEEIREEKPVEEAVAEESSEAAGESSGSKEPQ